MYGLSIEYVFANIQYVYILVVENKVEKWRSGTLILSPGWKVLAATHSA
uniref:Uncharacterized protein n=1 Tax=Arundo donax TaxID=35708 RepID=A0A0A9F630_ARUDO